MVPEALPPRILLVMPDQWPRALLRASLREVGYDAAGTRVPGMVRREIADQAGRGPVRLVLMDQEAVTDADERDLEAIRSAEIPVVLLAPSVLQVREGPWAEIVRRPFSVGDLVRVVERLLPLAPEARRPLD
jgi:hypothetical protein